MESALFQDIIFIITKTRNKYFKIKPGQFQKLYDSQGDSLVQREKETHLSITSRMEI